MSGVIFYFCAFLLSISCFTYFSSRKIIQKNHSRVFKFLVINISVTSLCGFISNYIEDTMTASGLLFFIQYFTQLIWWMAHNTLSPFYALFTMMVNGSGLKKSKGFFNVFMAPALFVQLLIITNPLTKLIFTYDENADYLRGPLVLIPYAVSVIYLCIGIFFMIRYRKAISKEINRALWYFFSFTIIGIIIQFIFPEMKVELLAEAFSILGVMLTIENEEEFVDASVGTYNRRGFILDNQNLIATSQRYAIVNVEFTNMRFYSRLLDSDSINSIYIDIIGFFRSLTRKMYIYRLSDHCFSLLIFYTEAAELDRIWGKIQNKFSEPVKYDDIILTLNTNIYVVRVPEDCNSVGFITELVNYPMELETPGVKVFRGEDLKFINRHISVESALKRAIDHDGFEVYYQPIWSAAEDRIHSCEALLRLNDEKLGFIPPDEFIGIAEKNGLISQIGLTVFEKVCHFISGESFKGLGLNFVEINLSIYQLIDGDCVSEFEKIMKKYNVRPDEINLEITETGSANNFEGVQNQIYSLMDMGIEFSLDDFGKGYSNLDYIVNNRFVNIKSDKGLLWNSDKSSKSRIMLEDSIGMIRRLNMNLIQEGVETAEQLKMVTDAGANYIQGYYFSKPLPEKEFVEFVRGFKGEAFVNAQ